jgi:D-alanine transaminase/branched-chain amino acid aminotransferase
MNGEFKPKDQCFLHITDLSIHRSYAVFDYLIFIDKVPIYIEDYLMRFRNSVKLMGLELPFSDSELENIVLELINVNRIDMGGIKFLYTGGYAANGYDAEKPNFIIMHMAYPHVPEKYFKNGIKLILENYVRDFATAKTTDYFYVLSVKNKIKAANAFDILYQKNGIISESSRSNFFIIDQDNRIITTKDEILFGVTRKNLIKAIGHKYEIVERPIYTSELASAKEAFPTSSVKRVIPIIEIDDLKIGDGKPGEISRDLALLLKNQDELYIKEFPNRNK